MNYQTIKVTEEEGIATILPIKRESAMVKLFATHKEAEWIG